MKDKHSRKFSKKASNQDILNDLWVSSHPYISTKKHKMIRKHNGLSEGAKTSLILHEHFDEGSDLVNIELVEVVKIDTISDLVPDNDN